MEVKNTLLPYVDISKCISKKNILLGTKNANELLINHLFTMFSIAKKEQFVFKA